MVLSLAANPGDPGRFPARLVGGLRVLRPALPAGANAPDRHPADPGGSLAAIPGWLAARSADGCS